MGRTGGRAWGIALAALCALSGCATTGSRRAGQAGAAASVGLAHPPGVDSRSPVPMAAPKILEGGPPAGPVPGAAEPAVGQRGGAPGGHGLARRVGDLPGSGVGPADRVVALTFDDGPDPRFTPMVLDVLSHYQVPATFFMIGWEAAASPDLVRRVAGAGDGVGNHTWNHLNLTRLGEAGLAAQVDRTGALLSSEAGWKVTCIRPPEGMENPGLLHRLSQRGLTTVLWSADTRDWTRPGTDTIVRRALAGLGPGTIILLHDGGGDRSETLAALPRIIESVRSQGYRLVPICR